MEIGKMTPPEWPWIVARSAATGWEHVLPALRPQVTPEMVAANVRQALWGLLSQPGNVALVARESGRPVGYLLVAFMPDEVAGVPTALFWDIWVEPEWRGKGVSSRLTAAGEEQCRAVGVHVIRRVVATHNAASLRHAEGDGSQPERIVFVKVI
jgi:GNAT superfamily N-acetyltransferase